MVLVEVHIMIGVIGFLQARLEFMMQDEAVPYVHVHCLVLGALPLSSSPCSLFDKICPCFASLLENRLALRHRRHGRYTMQPQALGGLIFVLNTSNNILRNLIQ